MLLEVGRPTLCGQYHSMYWDPVLNKGEHELGIRILCSPLPIWIQCDPQPQLCPHTFPAMVL